MRRKNAARNIITSWGQKILVLVLSFILRTVFIQTLGVQFVGLDSLFINILSLLSLSELGIGIAIQYSLYKPIAEKDNNKIQAIMVLFKRVYRWVALSVLVFGVIVSFFIPLFVKEPPKGINLTIVFYLFLLDIILSYFYSYNRTLLIANQHGYRLHIIDAISKFILFSVQILILILFKNYYVFLIIKIFINFSENIYISYYVNKIYVFLKDKNKQKLSVEENSEIKKNVKALFMHKLGDFCINSTDNIIISSFINVASVGILSNYNLVISGINTFINSAFSELTAGIGNLIVTESDEKKHQSVEILNFAAFWMYGLAGIAFFNLLNPFIALWVGEKYLLSETTLGLIVFSQYLTGMRVPLSTFKIAAGVFQQDKWIPFIQSIVNLVLSILLVKPLGISGVILGTIISSVFVSSWNRPYMVYKYALNRSVAQYFKKFFVYLVLVALNAICIRYIFMFYLPQVSIFSFIIKTFICLFVPCSTFVIVFRKSKEFVYIKVNLVRTIQKRGAT